MTDSCSTRAPPPITHIDLLAKDRAENAKAPPAGKSSCPQRHFCSAVELRSRAKAHKAAKPPDFAQGKIPSILNHEAKMLACKGISALPSNVTSCGATRRTGGGTPPILAIRQVSWEYLTTKQKCLRARAFLLSRRIGAAARRRGSGKAALILPKAKSQAY